MKKILSGKVRDVYEVNDHELVIVTTDRISAFDVILPSTIKNKGVALNLLSLYWFDYTKTIIICRITFQETLIYMISVQFWQKS